ncbi:hypothetical protein, partial [Frankia sp. CiP3]|uniref:hypothetical protein n=1 Tax=Frankia sp. CiP3 TaxID=2880971 RepID=UPI001EF4FCF2
WLRRVRAVPAYLAFQFGDPLGQLRGRGELFCLPRDQRALRCDRGVPVREQAHEFLVRRQAGGCHTRKLPIKRPPSDDHQRDQSTRSGERTVNARDPC